MSRKDPMIPESPGVKILRVSVDIEAKTLVILEQVDLESRTTPDTE